MATALKWHCATWHPYKINEPFVFIISDFIRTTHEIPLVLASKTRHHSDTNMGWDREKVPETGLIRCFDAEQNKWIWFDTEAISETQNGTNTSKTELYFEQAKLPVSKGWHCKMGMIIYQQLLKYFRKRWELLS